MFKTGDLLDAELMYENERIIRALPYIKDVKFILEKDTINTNLVKVHVLTKDRFSFGVTGGVETENSAALEMYNQNIFGVGHEISFRFVGHLNPATLCGWKLYKINNIRGSLSISAGYMNTFRREGMSFILKNHL